MTAFTDDGPVSFTETPTERREPLEFEYGGQRFHPSLTLLDLKRHKHVFGVEVDSAAGAVAVLEIFEQMLGEEYPAFEQMVRARRTTPAKLMEIFSWVMAQEFGDDEDPTQPQTAPNGPAGASVNGRSSTGPTSGDRSSSVDSRMWRFATDAALGTSGLSVEEQERAKAVIERVEQILSGRMPGSTG